MNTDERTQTAIEDRPSNRMSSAGYLAKIAEVDKVRARLVELKEMESVREHNKELIDQNARQANTIYSLSSEMVNIKNQNDKLKSSLQYVESMLVEKDKEIAKLRRNTRRTRR